MNRYLIICAGLLAVIVAVEVVLYVRSSPPPAQQGSIPVVTYPSDSTDTSASSESQSTIAVQSAFRNEIASYDTDNTKLYQTVISGGYALQVWVGDNFGGEALLRYDDAKNRWAVITGGGGSWSVGGLVQAGVPQDTASALLAGVPH